MHSAAPPRSRSPVDEDLQRLYNDVWAGFAEETPSAPQINTNLDGIYNRYQGLNAPLAYNPGSPLSVSSPQIYGQENHLQPSPSTPVSSSPSSRRRLPPTPGGSSSSNPNTPISMPDSYYDPKRPSHYSVESYNTVASSTSSNDLLKKATSASAINNGASSNGRRLPQAPGYESANGRRSPMPGLPADPRPQSNTAHRSYQSTSSSSSADRHHSPYRPPGALPPTVPGLYERPEQVYSPPGFDIYNTEAASNYANYVQRPAPPVPQPPALNHQYNFPVPDTLDVPRISHRPSYENMAYTTSPVSEDPYGGIDSQISGLTSRLSNTNLRDRDPSPTNIQPSALEDSNFPNPYSASLPPPLPPKDTTSDEYYANEKGGGPSNMMRSTTEVLRTLADYDAPHEPFELHGDMEDVDGGTAEYWEDEEEEDENRFVNFSLLSHVAMQLRDKVPRGTHVKGSIPYPRAFTGKDIVSTIQSLIQRELAINHGVSTNDRRVALQVSRSLQSQLFFYEVEWGGRVLQDGVEDVYMFLDDQEGGSDMVPEREELPTGVVTLLTRCYVPSCGEGYTCYAYGCPRNGSTIAALPPIIESPVAPKDEEWTKTVDEAVLRSLPESEVNRQNIIHKIITKEEQYLQDLDIVESVFIQPLRRANPPVMVNLEEFIDEVFGNILDLRECNRRLLEVMYVRQREQSPIIQKIGDIFLEAATEFRLAYPTYIGHHPIAEKRMKDEVESNPEFRLFLEHCSRQNARQGESIRLDLKHFLNRPAEHLQKYPVMLEAVMNETAEGNPDADFLREAIDAIQNLQNVAQLLTFQLSMGKGAAGKWEWHDLVSTELRKSFTKKEAKRQSIIFELIKGEMGYVKDLENMEYIFIQPLRAADPPIIPPDRLDQWIEDVFHNFSELHAHHLKLLQKFHEIQREQHPLIRSVTAALYDAALNWRDAYMEYIPNYPIGTYRIDDETNNNPAFKDFIDACVRHPDAHRLDMKSFINRPIPRLLRYELLLKGIMDESEPGHEDLDTIPHVIDIIKSLGKESEPGVTSAKQKVDLWKYSSNLVFKPGESIDMDLLNPNRSLIHYGKLLRQPESGLEWNGWSELFVLLFDNYLVMTKTKEAKERDGNTKYHVNRRPIPLDLLTLVNYTDPPTQRGTGLLRNLRGERHDSSSVLSPENANDSRSVFPITLHHNGRLGGPYILYADSAAARIEWKSKLEDALGLRKAVQESNKVFEIETLSADTFLVPSIAAGAQGPTWNQDITYTGKVTCSVPFNTPDGRALVAIGCAEGVWIGFRHDPKSMRRVLHLKMVTQCAMLEEFGIFLVLADKSLFAYHIEALVPSSPHAASQSQVPQKLNGTKDVHFFSVGQLHGRTLIVYMKKKGLDSIFRVLEPVGDKINERVKAPVGLGSRLGFRSAKSEWFRVYRDFFLPSESFDLIFLKARIAILCAKGFEIMDLNDFNSVTIPMREEPRLAPLAKRCESCRPMGMFRSNDDEFLLVYDEFGVYVDKHGDPNRSAGTIEWEGTAERVAFHSPYILLFDTRFIEIRHIETGRLAQIIPGNEVRCIWDGRGVSSNAAATPALDGGLEDAKVHAVMNNTDSVSGGGRPRVIAQHVFELLPTIPLDVPGPVNSARSTNGFIYPNVSPPVTPGGRTSVGSWRS